MCGFAAFFEAGRNFDKAFVTAVDRDLYHRGPDSGGLDDRTGQALIFRRLAIMDPLPQSDQPMQAEDGQATLMFNGEIYNHLDLRRELEAQGAIFKTHSDTETVLQGFLHWGTGLLDRLEGMFACVFVDYQKQSVIAARDPYGIKPLYMARNGNAIGFSSESRPLRRFVGSKIDLTALSELLLFGFAANNLSNFRNIDLIPAGGFVTYQLQNGAHQTQRYYDILSPLSGEKWQGNPSELEEMIETGVRTSVKDHLQSDVGYALQLSGGIDSSLVTAIASEFSDQPLRTFGVRLEDERNDEGPWRRMVCDRYPVIHKEVTLTGEDFGTAWSDGVTAMEGPVPHLACIMLRLLCREIAKTDKVVLTGEGADEFFGGYDRYKNWQQLDRYARFARMLPEFLWLLARKRYSALEKFRRLDPSIASIFYRDYQTVAELFPDLIPNVDRPRASLLTELSDFRDRMNGADLTGYLESLLMRQDKMSMAESVEVRVPFTHRPLGSKILSIPRDIRIPGGSNKPLLKTLAEKYLPHELIHRRKVGFTLPWKDWMAKGGPLESLVSLMLEPDARLGQYGNHGKIRQLTEDFLSGKNVAAYKTLVMLANIELWLRSTEKDLAV